MATFSGIQNERFIGVTIANKEEVYPALRNFFSPRDALAGSPTP